MHPSQRVYLCILVFNLCALLTPNRAIGQDDLKQKVGKVFDLIYDYRLVSADSSIAAYEKQFPSHPVWPLLRANVAWWQILSGKLDDDELNRTFIDQLNTSKTLAKNYELNENEAAFSLIIINAFRTRFDLLNNNYLTAAGYLNACIDDISDSFGQEESYEPFHLTSGLYYYFMQKAHDDYPIMRPYLFFFPDGDKEKGLSYLKRCTTSKDVFLRDEATYFLMRIALDLDKKPEEALFYTSALLKRHPNNVIFRLFEINILHLLERAEDEKQAERQYLISLEANTELTEAQKDYFKTLIQPQKKAPN